VTGVSAMPQQNEHPLIAAIAAPIPGSSESYYMQKHVKKMKKSISCRDEQSDIESAGQPRNSPGGMLPDREGLVKMEFRGPSRAVPVGYASW